MSTWIVEPHHSVIFRDGRPFGPNPGARAASLAFPYPSTTAGGARTRAGQDVAGRFVADPAEVKQIKVRGPLLVELNEEGHVARCLVPAPSDALLLDLPSPDVRRATRKRLVPLGLPAGASTDLPDGLQPVGLPIPDPNKPHKQAPAFWFWEEVEAWLHTPQASDQIGELALLGHGGPTREQRMHVSISDEQGTAEEGALFQTQGLEFTHTVGQSPSLDGTRLALALVVDDERIDPGVAPLGGERRLVHWKPSKEWALPVCPQPIRDTILQHRCCRVLLLTPAHFAAGYHPEWLLHAGTGLAATMVAAAVGHPQVVSGWDFVAGQPKQTRRLAPAGSLYFLRFPDTTDEATLNDWIDAVWMQNVSDAAQDRLDGFGLAALGTWDGALHELKVKEKDS